MEESDYSKCRRCETLKLRKFVGYFPDKRNKKYVDEEGSQCRGRICPDCVRKEVKSKIKGKRKNARSGDSGSN